MACGAGTEAGTGARRGAPRCRNGVESRNIPALAKAGGSPRRAMPQRLRRMIDRSARRGASGVMSDGAPAAATGAAVPRAPVSVAIS